MSKEILLVAEAVANEKGVDKEIIFEAIEAALAQAARKRSEEDIDVRVSIDRKTGDYEAFRRWEVVADDEELEFPDRQIHLSEARKDSPEVEVGDFLEQPMDPPEFGRIAAQSAKQVIVQRVRDAERAKVVDEYKDRVGEILSGVVKRVDKGNVYLDLGNNAEAIVPREFVIPREIIRTGERLRGWLKEVRTDTRGPQLVMSRTAPEFLIELFKIEVPEIGQGLVEIMGAARDPGLRAKIGVRSLDRRTDPVGACVGMRGSRVQAVTNEISGERIDIILWDENPAQYVINAMAPAEVKSIVVDEEEGSMDIAVEEESLSKAIGRGGQNVRLASELTGWRLNVMSEEEIERKRAEETSRLVQQFMEGLDIDEDLATVLVDAGFTTVEEIAYVPASELAQIEGFDDELVEALRGRARDAMLIQLIAKEEVLEEHKPAEDLLALEGMDQNTAYALAARGIVTQEDLAEQSIDELLDIEGMDETRAGELIMAARAPWFAESD